MQSPNGDNRDDQNHEIAHNIYDARADEYSILIKTFLSFRNFAGLADALSCNGEDKGERVKEVPVEDKPDARVKLGISVSSFM